VGKRLLPILFVLFILGELIYGRDPELCLRLYERSHTKITSFFKNFSFFFQIKESLQADSRKITPRRSKGSKPKPAVLSLFHGRPSGFFLEIRD